MSSNCNYTATVFELYRTCSNQSFQTTLELFVTFCSILNSVFVIRLFRSVHIKMSAMDIFVLAIQLAFMTTVLLHSLELIFRLRCPLVATGTTSSLVILALLTITEPSMQIVNWLIPVLCLWRLVAVVQPFRARAMLTNKQAVLIVITVMFMSCIWSIVMCLYHYSDRNYHSYYDKKIATCFLLPKFVQQQAEDDLFERRNFLILQAIISSVPIILASCFNSYLVFRVLYETRRQKELHEGQTNSKNKGQCTKMTLAFLLSFLTQVFGYCLPDVFELVVFLCPKCLAVNKHTCFLFFNFPALIYSGFLVAPLYCLLSGRIRDNFKQCFVVQGFKTILDKCRWRNIHSVERTSSQDSRKYIFTKECKAGGQSI